MKQLNFKTLSLQTVSVAICFLLLSFATVDSIFAQGRGGGGQRPLGTDNRPTGTVKGKIIDSDTKNPVPRATVTINNPTTRKQITGGFTDRNGDFNINVNPGNYFIRISFLGYEAYEIPNVRITPNDLNFNAGTVSLKMTTVMTQEVRVEAEREAIEVGLDRRVFNVEQDVTNLGGSAIDVLANIPSVTVDQDDNISLRGNSNVNIMIDGRMSNLSASEALEQIPATMISSVELITNPGARFDAGGTAGIINIVTTRQRNDGVNAMINLNAGTDDVLNPRFNGSAAANWNIGKWNVFANFSGRHGNRSGTRENNRTVWRNGVPSYLEQNDSTQGGGRFASTRVGADYNFTKNDVLTYSLRVNQMKRFRDQEQEYSALDANRDLVGRYDRNIDNSSHLPFVLNTENALSYKKNFAQRGHELFADVFYTTWDRKNVRTDYEQINYVAPYFTTPDDNPLFEKNISNTVGRVLLTQLDYARPVGKNLKIEAGGKFSNRTNTIDNEFSIMNNNTDNKWIVNPNTSDDFRYTEQIFAAYATASSSIGNLKFNAGVRSETTVIGFDSYRIDSSFTDNYTMLFPSVYLSYELNPSHQFTANFSSRIRRPSFWDINPAVNYEDPLNLSTGNPTLKPESSYAGELGYLLNVEKTTVTTTVFYRYTTDGIERYRRMLNNSDTTMTMPENISNTLRTGFELIAMQRINNWWRVDGNYTFYNTTMDATNIPGGIDRNDNNWSVRLNSVMNYKRLFETQLSGSYRSRMLRAQGQSDPSWNIDASFRYNYSRQLSFSFRVRDIFNTHQWNSYEEAFDQYGNRILYNSHKHQWYNRNYSVGMTYRFQDFKQRRDRQNEENMRNAESDD